MEKKLVLENTKGNVVRTFRLDKDNGLIVYRKDIKRLEVWEDESHAQEKNIPFEKIAPINKTEVSQKALSLGSFGQLRMLDIIENVPADPQRKKTKSTFFWSMLLGLTFITFGTLSVLMQMSPTVSEEKIEEQKVQVVKLIQKVKIQQQQVQQIPQQMVVNKTEEVKATTNKNLSKNVKRMGALAVLGSLSTGKQKAGLNLGAVNTTAGAGLGGTGGSGGVQTSLYAKGIVAAPVGPGGNVQGAGGYGTKGKGGGQAGYGTLSLVGSAGTSTIPLGQEAIVEGGLDRDVIAAIVNRNSGQIRFCYEQALQMEPSLAGRVVVRWTINGQGIVVNPSIASSTMNSKAVEDCILLRLRSWKFPMPQGGVNVTVAGFPFVLNRAGTAAQ